MKSGGRAQPAIPAHMRLKRLDDEGKDSVEECRTRAEVVAVVKAAMQTSAPFCVLSVGCQLIREHRR